MRYIYLVKGDISTQMKAGFWSCPELRDLNLVSSQPYNIATYMT